MSKQRERLLVNILDQPELYYLFCSYAYTAKWMGHTSGGNLHFNYLSEETSEYGLWEANSEGTGKGTTLKLGLEQQVGNELVRLVKLSALKEKKTSDMYQRHVWKNV